MRFLEIIGIKTGFLKIIKGMDKNKLKEQIKKDIVWETIDPHRSGGQSCGVPIFVQTLSSNDLNIKISIGCKRSSLKNRDLAYLLFELALDELIK